MMILKIHANGHASYLEMLQTKLKRLIEKINKDRNLSPSEKFEARQEAEKSIRKDKKESLKNCY